MADVSTRQEPLVFDEVVLDLHTHEGRRRGASALDFATTGAR
jgi:hypothetical protein